MRSTPTDNFRVGFTLIELLVVMCILGICGAMTVASVGSQDDLLVSAASRSVIADFNYAQTRAISLRKKVFIQQTGNQYALLSRNSDASAPTAITNPVTHETYNASFQSADSALRDVKLAAWSFAAASTIGFDELGCPFTYDAAHNVTTSMTSTGSISLTSGTAKVVLTLQPFTGELNAE